MSQANLKLRLQAGRRQPSDLPLRVGQWEVVDRVNRGELCQVFRARPVGAPDGPAAYALKMLSPKWRDDPRAIRLVRREALVGREVAHPHLVSILSANVDLPPYFVVMPWLTGQRLDLQLAAGGGVDLPVALWLVRQVAEALAALDSAGWMHGDVKPENVLVSPEGHVTLLDLGFARRRDETGSVVERCVMGTYNYIAPELITSAFRADVRSDVYSLGVTLFEMLSGRLPFEGKDLAELASQHKEARPPDLRRLAPHLPTSVIRLVREMLAKDPLRRPQTPGELVERVAGLEIATFGERSAD